MKIESSNLRNETINFSNKLIKFDKNGIASVDEEIGKEFIKEFPNSYWEFGKKPIVEIKKDFIKEEGNKEIVSLKNEILKLKGIIDSLKVELKNSQEETEVWKSEFNKLKEDNLSIDVCSEYNEDDEVEKDELKSELENMTVSDLKKLLKNDFKEEEKNYKGLNKEQLIVKILEKTK